MDDPVILDQDNQLLYTFLHRKKSRDNQSALTAQRLVNLFRHLSSFKPEFVSQYNQMLLNASDEIQMMMQDIVGGPTVRQYLDHLRQAYGQVVNEPDENTENQTILPSNIGYLPSPDEEMPFFKTAQGFGEAAPTKTTEPIVTVQDFTKWQKSQEALIKKAMTAQNRTISKLALALSERRLKPVEPIPARTLNEAPTQIFNESPAQPLSDSLSDQASVSAGGFSSNDYSTPAYSAETPLQKDMTQFEEPQETESITDLQNEAPTQIFNESPAQPLSDSLSDQASVSAGGFSSNDYSTPAYSAETPLQKDMTQFEEPQETETITDLQNEASEEPQEERFLSSQTENESLSAFESETSALSDESDLQPTENSFAHEMTIDHSLQNATDLKELETLQDKISAFSSAANTSSLSDEQAEETALSESDLTDTESDDIPAFDMPTDELSPGNTSESGDIPAFDMPTDELSPGNTSESDDIPAFDIPTDEFSPESTSESGDIPAFDMPTDELSPESTSESGDIPAFDIPTNEFSPESTSESGDIPAFDMPTDELSPESTSESGDIPAFDMPTDELSPENTSESGDIPAFDIPTDELSPGNTTESGDIPAFDMPVFDSPSLTNETDTPFNEEEIIPPLSFDETFLADSSEIPSETTDISGMSDGSEITTESEAANLSAAVKPMNTSPSFQSESPEVKENRGNTRFNFSVPPTSSFKNFKMAPLPAGLPHSPNMGHIPSVQPLPAFGTTGKFTPSQPSDESGKPQSSDETHLSETKF